MLFKTLKSIAFIMMLPFVMMASNTEFSTDVTLEVTPEGEVVAMYENSWTHPGGINQNYLDFAHTQRTWNNIQLEPGAYDWSIELRRNNGKRGKVNLDIKLKYQNGSTVKILDRKLSSDRGHNGSVTLHDYKSQSSGSPAGYSKIKVHIGRAGANTNCNYKIRLTKTGPPDQNPPTPYPGGTYGNNNNNTSGSNSGNYGNNNNNNNNSGNSGNYSNNNNNNGGCTYSELGKGKGTVYSNTRGKVVSKKKACKKRARVVVKKKGGKARTLVHIYKTRNKNQTGTHVETLEYAPGSAGGVKSYYVDNADGYFIRVEMKNKSATKKFKYEVKITQ